MQVRWVRSGVLPLYVMVYWTKFKRLANDSDGPRHGKKKQRGGWRQDSIGVFFWEAHAEYGNNHLEVNLYWSILAIINYILIIILYDIFTQYRRPFFWRIINHSYYYGISMVFNSNNYGFVLLEMKQQQKNTEPWAMGWLLATGDYHRKMEVLMGKP